MKGIILAGGIGKRLRPITAGVSKQLLPIYDKPMIYYPVSTLMLAEIREILIISTSQDIENFKRLLGDGGRFGLRFRYAVQDKPRGIGEAFIIGEKFIGKQSVCLILGDNIFYGQGLPNLLKKTKKKNKGASIFGYHVSNPREFGVAKLDKNFNIIGIEEKPIRPSSRYAITGLYFYNNEVIKIAKNLRPSKRGEYEITDINSQYLSKKMLSFNALGRGFAWLDTGTPDSLINASNFVQTIETRQGLKIACLEEIAFKKKWITEKNLLDAIKFYGNTSYGIHLKTLIEKV